MQKVISKWSLSIVLMLIVITFFASFIEMMFPTPDILFESIDFSKEGQLLFDDAFRGSNPNGEIVMAYFLDFRCPACIEQHPDIQKIQDNYPQLNFIYKPLAVIDPGFSPFAAIVYECARQQDAGFTVADYLFEQQYTQSEILEIVESTGIDMPMFTECINDESTSELISADNLHASYLEVKGTPTIFIDGVKVEGIHSYEVYEALIERRLKEE